MAQKSMPLASLNESAYAPDALRSKAGDNSTRHHNFAPRELAALSLEFSFSLGVFGRLDFCSLEEVAIRPCQRPAMTSAGGKHAPYPAVGNL
jgi:hypothetical protein